MTNDTYTSPRIRTNSMRANSLAPTSRQNLGHLLGTDEEEPTLWQAVNYPKDSELDEFDTHWLRYERQGVAAGLIDRKIGDTWQEMPEVVDESSADDEAETEFDDEIQRFVSGETLRQKPLHRLSVADKLATLGQYSIIVLGFDDGNDLEEPVPVVDENDDESEGTKAFDSLDNLNYIATFGQDRVIEPLDVNTDMSSERFRRPEMYEVITEEPGDSDSHDAETQKIHWSRVIHVAEGTLEDDLRGTPYLKNIFHNLVNLDKILAGSAEGYWRGGYAGMVIRPPTGPGGKLLRFDDGDGEGSSELQEEIDAYERNMQRTIATTGEVDTLAPNVSDPAPHVNQQFKEIATAKGVPQSMLMGNETGERATTEDSAMRKEQVAGLRNNYAEPSLVRPLIDRLINTGVFPTPNGDGYEVEWPALDELTEQEEADVAKTLAEAISTLTGGQPDRISEQGELRELVGWDPTIGSESDVDDEDQPGADEEEPVIDENDPAVQDAFDAQQSNEQFNESQDDDGGPDGDSENGN